MNKKCLIAIITLLAIIAGGTYKFIFQGSVSPGADVRTAVLLTATERNLVLEEMRTFLVSIQQITHGISNDDMALVAQAAKKSGKAAQKAMPGSLMGKLPIEFKQLGSDTHSRFDLLALDAESLADSDHALGQLSTLMENCVACHASYRFEIVN